MKYLLFISLIGLANISFGQIKQKFPLMEGENLLHQKIMLPNDVKGKHTLIGLAFSKNAESDLKTWFNPLYQTFIHRPKNPGPFDFSYDIHCYFIPMFSGMMKAAYNKVIKKMEKELDPLIAPHILFYKGELNVYKKELNFKDKDVPYFYVLDENGNIRYLTQGKYTKEKMQEIVDAVQEALE